MAYIDLIFTNWSFVMMTVDINICNYIPEAYIAFGIVPVEKNQCNYIPEAYIAFGIVSVEMNQCNYKQEAYIDQRFIIWPLVMYW